MILILNVGMKGFLRLQLINKFSGKCRIDTGFFPNTILDAGRNNMAVQANWLTYAKVGTDNTTPSQSDTSLLGHIASTNDIQSDVHGAEGSAPYFGWKRKVWRFPVGPIGNENLKEAAIGWGPNDDDIISRALIIDPILQTPTTITPLADEILDLTYELRYYPPLVDALSTVTLNGVIYDTITRAADVTGSRWSSDIGSFIGQYSLFNSDWGAYDDDIGTILQSPSGLLTSCDNDDQVNSSYQNNSYEMQVNSACGPSGWNVPGGIRSIRIRTTAGDYQTQFNAQSDDSKIPKTSSFTMDMAWKIAWSEKV